MADELRVGGVAKKQMHRCQRDWSCWGGDDLVLEARVGKAEAEWHDGLSNVEAVSAARVGSFGAMAVIFADGLAIRAVPSRGPRTQVEIEDGNFIGIILRIHCLYHTAGRRLLAEKDVSQANDRDTRLPSVQHGTNFGIREQVGDVQWNCREDDDDDGLLCSIGDLLDEVHLTVLKCNLPGVIPFTGQGQVRADAEDNAVGRSCCSHPLGIHATSRGVLDAQERIPLTNMLLDGGGQ
mmetsp:Transcript_70505/g.229266  ORF Transcript_70505/g.229266 Transcript_70505/m.229266 type:complete len:237 (+) Transcript_70505:449-1159(+)